VLTYLEEKEDKVEMNKWKKGSKAKAHNTTKRGDVTRS